MGGIGGATWVTSLGGGGSSILSFVSGKDHAFTLGHQHGPSFGQRRVPGESKVTQRMKKDPQEKGSIHFFIKNLLRVGECTRLFIHAVN